MSDTFKFTNARKSFDCLLDGIKEAHEKCGEGEDPSEYAAKHIEIVEQEEEFLIDQYGHKWVTDKGEK